jgi:hypothetical protein
MNFKRSIALGSAALIGAALLVPAIAEAKGKCTTVGGQGTGLTPEIATLMATNALSEALASYGGKGKGKVTTKCDGMVVMATCTAKQRACK